MRRLLDTSQPKRAREYLVNFYKCQWLEMGKHRFGNPKAQQPKIPSYHYIKVRLAFDKRNQGLPHVTKVQLKTAILDALNQLFGEYGRTTPVDVLKYDAATSTAILRTLDKHKQVAQALTLHNRYAGMECAYHIEQYSAHLVALSTNSRTNSRWEDLQAQRQARKSTKEPAEMQG